MSQWYLLLKKIFIRRKKSPHSYDQALKFITDDWHDVHTNAMLEEIWNVYIELKKIRPKMFAYNIMFINDNPYEDGHRSEVDAITGKVAKWMTDGLKREFVVQFRRYGTVKQRQILNRRYKDIFRVMADMNITGAQYEDLKLWYIRSKNQTHFGLSKNIQFCFMYTESETCESEDCVGRNIILNEGTRDGRKEIVDNESGAVEVCMMNWAEARNKANNVLDKEVMLIMAEAMDGIEYANTISGPEHGGPCIANDTSYSVHEIEVNNAGIIVVR
ncbi:uncharacterized protein C8R40DRAFT_1074303 [Lentinula edodes]|uniref:uncharacterized protein n=1 Tax=Lentinula edodes TaxID=5353 RepID=UPI001E8EC310|nr:uncharacterized protein C8R40DRAFT_1074303 [Lentinula edodes]KAH7869107.1 hypothetical protein C8R40DRAFT_1074303 [Lentinula edodes]